MPELEVVKVPTEDLLEYQNNAKLHPSEQVDQIAASIEEFGFNSPILAWHNDDGEPEIVAGHGRLMAARKLGLEELPVVFLDHMGEEQRRAYILVDNQLTMNSGFDDDILAMELDAISVVDMSEFGFIDEVLDDEVDDRYTTKVDVPQYDITGEDTPIEELCDTKKTDELVKEIDSASGISESEKEFLKLAAQRHLSFDYAKIAEYYAGASHEMQQLMEQSALVIVDVDNAIANGYARLSKSIEGLREG
jgi:hypothetical protein